MTEVGIVIVVELEVEMDPEEVEVVQEIVLVVVGEAVATV